MGANNPVDGQSRADLVLEGGGVKGIAHIGAVTVLEQHGYAFPRVAGTSAGAVAAAFVAACMAAGKKVSEIEPLMWPGKTADSIDYRKVPGGKLPAPFFEQVRQAFSMLFHDGFFDGDYLREWLFKTLKDSCGVQTFGDLKLQDANADLAANQRYSLVVMVSDISRGSLVRLPWDYGLYGLDPDKQYVADAVRASTSIPYFFEPAKLSWGGSPNVSYLVDGGALSDFPIEIFDRTDSQQPRWPTFGIKLSSKSDPSGLTNQIDDPVDYSKALLETIINGNDQVHMADPCVIDRTIFIDTSSVGATEFNLTDAQQADLFAAGQKAADQFIAAFDWAGYKTECCTDLAARRVKALAARGELPAPVAAG